MVAAIKNGVRKEPYNFEPGFEAQLVALCCTRPKFYARIGPELDVECLGRPDSVLAMKAAVAVCRDLGVGPDSGKVLLQRLRRWMNEGKITHADIMTVSDLLDEAEDAGLASEESVLGEVVPILQRRIQHAAIQESLSEYAKRGDPGLALAKIERAKQLGKRDLTRGIDFGDGSFGAMLRMRNVRRLKTGILELDATLDGGAMCGTESVLVGAAKSGKSQGLIQTATAGVLQGANVGYITLELPTPIVEARLAANMTNTPTNDILADPFNCGALEALDELRQRGAGGYGRMRVAQFTPKITFVSDLRAWVKSVEEEWGETMHLIVVDYADKLGAKTAGRREEDNSYKHGESVYEDLRIWVEGEKRWLWTASQGKRNTEKKGKKLDLDDIADSMGKVRVADLVITLNPSPDAEQMTFFIAANRLGKSRQTVGPLPTDFGVARIAPVSMDAMP